MNGQIVATADLNIVGEEAMVAFGRSLSSRLPKPLIITLQGDLGAGKTTLSRGVLQGLGHKGAVKSPTYTLVEPYKLAVGVVYHFDLYRFADEYEWDEAGFSEYFNETSVCMVEWPEKAGKLLPYPNIDVALTLSDSLPGRTLTIIAREVV